MKIVILGWGSLIWDNKNLEISSEWFSDGVTLPIEFARISKDGRLTLVLLEEGGSDVTTYWAESSFDNLNSAMANLQAREGTNTKGIGFIDLQNNTQQTRLSANTIKKIIEWAKSKKLDAVIWTDLDSNFQEKYKKPFSIDNATEYLNTLKGDAAQVASDYIKNAPEQTITELRLKLKP